MCLSQSLYESDRPAAARGSIHARMVNGTSYKSTPWSNVFRSGKKLWYRSRLLPQGRKAVSAVSLPALRKELLAFGIVMQRKENSKLATEIQGSG